MKKMIAMCGIILAAISALLAGCDSTLNSVAVTGVMLDRSVLNINVGETAKLSVTVSPDDATNKAVVWSSSNPDVMSIAADGTVTALAVGNATITATTRDGGYSSAAR